MEESVLLSLKGPGLKRNPGVRSGVAGRSGGRSREGRGRAKAAEHATGSFCRRAGGGPDGADEAREQTDNAERRKFRCRTEGSRESPNAGNPGRKRMRRSRRAPKIPNAGKASSRVFGKRCGARSSGIFAACPLPRRGAKGTGARFSPGSRSAEGFFQPFSRRPGPEVTMPRSMRRRRYQFLSLTSMWS